MSRLETDYKIYQVNGLVCYYTLYRAIIDNSSAIVWLIGCACRPMHCWFVCYINQFRWCI